MSRAPLLAKYRSYASWGQRQSSVADFEARFDDFAGERFLIGDAEQVKDGLLHYGEMAGTDHIPLRTR